MITNFKIDQARTFTAVAFLTADPKTAFKSDRQEMTKGDNPTPKWDVQVIAMSTDAFGRPQNEVLKVGVASHKNPGEGLAPYTPVALVEFEIGVMEKTVKHPETGEERVIGVQVWYRAQQIKAMVPAK